MASEWLIDKQIQELVVEIEAATNDLRNHLLEQLVSALRDRCRRPAVVEKYRNHQTQLPDTCAPFKAYPTDSSGYAVAFDPLYEEKEFWEHWVTYGFVVGKDVVSPAQCQYATQRVSDLLATLSGGKVHLNGPVAGEAIPTDEQGTASVSRGFFEQSARAIPFS